MLKQELYSYGVLQTGHCAANRAAQALTEVGNASSGRFPMSSLLLLLGMTFANDFVISLRIFGFEEPVLAQMLASKRHCLFRLALRLWQYGLDFIRHATHAFYP